MNKMWAVLMWNMSTGQENIVVYRDRQSQELVPLIAGDVKVMEEMRSTAYGLATRTQKQMRLVQFSDMKELERYMPNGDVVVPEEEEAEIQVEATKKEEKPVGKKVGVQCRWCEHPLEMDKEYNVCPNKKCGLSLALGLKDVYEEAAPA